jgi:transposase
VDQHSLELIMAFEPGKPGRKQKISGQVIDTICDFISKGASYETAAKAAGVSRRTLYNWLERAETEGGIYAEFRDRIEQQTGKTNVDLAEGDQEARHREPGLEGRHQVRWPMNDNDPNRP